MIGGEKTGGPPGEAPGSLGAERQVAGRRVGPIGLGGAKLSLGEHRPEEASALRTIHAALDAGVRLIDTSDIYCAGAGEAGHNERLVAKALRTWGGPAGEVLVATKGGQWWDAAGRARFDGSPARLRAACEASLSALGVEAIGLYLLHRLPLGRPAADSGGRELEASLEALQGLREEEKVLEIGLSNVTALELEALEGSERLAALENPLSAVTGPAGGELGWCARHQVAFLAWGPLAGTLPGRPPPDGEGSQRLAALSEVARRRGVSVQQVALAALLARSPQVIPLVGASRPETILDSLQAAQLELTEEELEGLDRGGSGQAGP